MSTVSVNKERLGRLAMGHLLARIGKKLDGPAQQHIVDVEFIQRDSSGPLKA